MPDIGKLDYALLADQKRTLLEVISEQEDAAIRDRLDGIVNLIDSIQDAAEQVGLVVPFWGEVGAEELRHGDRIDYEGETATVVSIGCDAVDTRHGGSYLYTFELRFGDGTIEQITRWDGDQVSVLR